MTHIDADAGTSTDTMQLVRLLTEALALADTLGLSIAAIHIDEAIAQIDTLAPATPEPALASVA